MSIPEKLITATENVQKVYESGKNSMVDESKLLPTTVSGSYISLDDVSEVPHKVECKISGVDNPESVTVTRCGKNMLKYPHWHTTKTVNGITFTDNGDGTVTANGTATTDAIYTVATYKLSKGITYTFSGCPVGGSKTTYYLNPRGYDYDVGAGKTLTPTYDFVNEVEIVIKSGATISNLLFKPQWELGDKATSYEPYNGQTLTPAADGTVDGMTSISPYMNVFSDTDGVSIEVTYNKSWGMQAEYDKFWDDFQQNGTRTNYYAAFAGVPWTVRTFKPKYKVVPIDTSFGTQNANSIFFHCNRNKRELIDFRTVAHLFDFSNVINPTRAFAESGIDYITTDFSNAETLNETFSQQWGANHTHITLTISDKCTNYNLCFANSTKLTDLIFTDGSIIAANLDLKDSPLNKESITSVINALSPTVSDKTLLLKKAATEAAFTDDEWAKLIATKANWNISLV